MLQKTWQKSSLAVELDLGNVSEVKQTGLADGVHVENKGNVKSRCIDIFSMMELCNLLRA